MSLYLSSSGLSYEQALDYYVSLEENEQKFIDYYGITDKSSLYDFYKAFVDDSKSFDVPVSKLSTNLA